jgi:hypothetical protein
MLKIKAMFLAIWPIPNKMEHEYNLEDQKIDIPNEIHHHSALHSKSDPRYALFNFW